jgi:rRNA maturation endonuclease Nob1
VQNELSHILARKLVKFFQKLYRNEFRRGCETIFQNEIYRCFVCGEKVKNRVRSYNDMQFFAGFS